jgi:hypothetical protein
MKTETMAKNIDVLPEICGAEDRAAQATARTGPFYLAESGIPFGTAQSGFSVALHMHQPLIPAGGKDLATARVISNLEQMLESGSDGDRYNATIFLQCYQRMARIISDLVEEGGRPRVMLDYSGCLLHGLCQMGATEVIASLRNLTTDPTTRSCVEWLGTAWGHAVAPSTPVQDYRLHVRAWQQYFASLFGWEALSRVRGFSPSEMALPNHPDVCYEFVKTLKECGYRWVLVQEHTVERVEDGGPLRDPHLPHRLVARNSEGQTLSITVLIKTQGSDTKLVGQMQPYYEAKNVGRALLAGKSVPRIATQIADGENGGVMMNEFPPKYKAVSAEATGTQTPAMNVTEYLEYLDRLGVTEADLPAVQPVMQNRIWTHLAGKSGSQAMEQAIEDLRKTDHRFHMEGGSWTSNVSWVRGYEKVLGPMQQASAAFAEKILGRHVPSTDPRYRRALYHLMIAQTSCFRYWGEGVWTDYGRELCRRAIEAMAGGA